MLWLVKVGGEHCAFIEVTERTEGLEVRGLYEAEIMNLASVMVVHKHPFLLADALPYGRSFACRRLRIAPIGQVLPAAVDAFRSGLLDAGRAVVRHIEEMILALSIADVAVNGCNLRIRIFKKKFRSGLYAIEVVVGIDVIELVGAVLVAHREVNHQSSCLLIVDGFGSPGATDVCQFGRHLVDVDNGVGPMNEVTRLHQHQTTVVSPTVCRAVTLPLRRTLALSLGVDVKVCGYKIECAVGSAIDMGVADATLLGNGVAANDGTGIVERREMIAVATQCHIQTMRVVAMEHHKVSRHVLLAYLLIARCRGKSQGQHEQKQKKFRYFLHCFEIGLISRFTA